jgi:hypothetical protein
VSVPQMTSARKGQNAVFLASYHAAMSYVRFRKKPCDDLILVDPTLKLFAEYFSTYASCRVMEDISSARRCSAFLDSLKIDTFEFWSYARSEVGMFTASYAKSEGIPTRFVLTTEYTDKLFKTDQFDLSFIFKEPKSLLKMVLQKMSGYPIRIKTCDNYLIDCIDTGFAESVTTYRELSASNDYSDAQFLDFADFTSAKYRDVIEDLYAQTKPCILLDEDLQNFYRVTGMQPEQGLKHIAAALEKLKSQNFSVNLKATYYGKTFLSEIYPFTKIIPREIPLEVLDMVLPPNIPVTGFSSTFLKARTTNLRPIGILQLLEGP